MSCCCGNQKVDPGLHSKEKCVIFAHRSKVNREHCRHDSLRGDDTLDDHCLRCGADGYWFAGTRHDIPHPSGKITFTLPSYSCKLCGGNLDEQGRCDTCAVGWEEEDARGEREFLEALDELGVSVIHD